MGASSQRRLRYCIMDPTGNVTALVEDVVEVGLQPEVAGLIMQRHPEVEQVGFVDLALPAGGADGVQARLRMAGGEFCGNATMSTAALWALRQGGATRLPCDVTLRVSGASHPVKVCLGQGDGCLLDAAVRMPEAVRIDSTRLSLEGEGVQVPVVRMEGISHVVVEEGTSAFPMRDDRPTAERMVREWCQELGADGLGLMFLGDGDVERELAPLVYVPGGDTVFWERSCASGSAAVGMLLAKREGGPVSLRLREPGGTLCVESDPATGDTWLRGHVRLVAELELSLRS